MKSYLLALSLLFLSAAGTGYGLAQGSLKDSSLRMASLEIAYLGAIPQGELAERFGFCSFIGLHGGLKSKSNWMFTTGFQGFFTDAVKETDMFNGIITSSGFFVGDDGLLSPANIQGRGFYIPFGLGKTFAGPWGPNPNSGFFLELGGSYLRHRIWTRATENDVAAISGAYRKGYDRLTAGWGLYESVGFRYLGNRGYVNLSCSLTAAQHFTRGRRSVQFDTGLPYLDLRQEGWLGFCVKWIFPIFSRAPEDVYFR